MLGDTVGVNVILLGWLMYRTGLMPPRLAMLGVIGGPLIYLIVWGFRPSPILDDARLR